MENNNEVNNLEKENLKNEQTIVNKGKNKKKKLWIIISLIIVIAIVGIIVYATSKDNCSNNITPRPSSGGSSSDPFGEMVDYKPLDENIQVKEQELVTPERNGFTIVEWGGTEIK